MALRVRMSDSVQHTLSNDLMMAMPSGAAGAVAPNVRDRKPGGFGRRSLADVLGEELASSLSKGSPEHQGPTEEDLDNLFRSPGAPAQRTQHATTSAADAVRAAAASVQQPPVEDAASKLISKQYGFAALGGVVVPPTSGSVGGSGGGVMDLPRLHPKRSFAPGQTYEPSVRTRASSF